MALKTFFTPRYKILIHGIVFILSWIGIQTTKDYCRIFKQEELFCAKLLETIVFVLTIYFLALILLPLLFKNWKKYIKATIIFLGIYSFLISWIFALNEVKINSIDKIFSNIPFGHFDFKLIFKAFMTIIPMGIFGLLYFVVIMDMKKFKNLFLKNNVERIFNMSLVVLILLYVSVMTNTKAHDLLIMTLVISFFYTNTFYIVPLLFAYKQKLKFVFISIIWFTALYILISLTHLVFYGDTFFEIKIFSLSSYLLESFTHILIPIYLLSFAYGYIRHRIKNQDKKLEAKESELQLLKSQVNPHFLFNTLNTLYATALEEQAPKTAESTAKLANLLRYMQEDINKEFIPLENEVKYVQDYIAIQKLRCSVTPQIETKFENIDNKVISPGLLIPFVENAFKYGIDPSKASKLKVSVICDEDTIHFECVNSFDNDFKTYYKEQGFGIGIKNAKQRLELTYPKKYQLEIQKENNIFSVKLSIVTITK